MNKPQCETAADCLRGLARVMDQFGISCLMSAINSKFVKFDGNTTSRDSFPLFGAPETWSFAIAEVEGKPVFVGDELYSVINGNKYTATEAGWAFDNWTHGPCASVENMSWNPPKPKTVMVEMLVEDAEYYAANESDRGQRLDRHIAACKKALEDFK